MKARTCGCGCSRAASSRTTPRKRRRPRKRKPPRRKGITTMRQNFGWRFVLCLLPILLAAWVVYDKLDRYARGEPGGPKLGVDLVGGTSLIYEVDERRMTERQKQDYDSKML